MIQTSATTQYAVNDDTPLDAEDVDLIEKAWIEKAKNEKLFTNDNSFHVFAFLLLVWTSSTDVKVTRDLENVCVSISSHEVN